MINIAWKRWILSAVAGVSLGAIPAFAQNPAPITTRNAQLRLPVQLDERARLEVAEVKLYVRGPAGRTECVQSGPSSQTAFDFKASIDGEYRFTFVTVDRRGVATPANVDTVPPHRIVVVDSTPPDVSAEIVDLKGGKFIQCRIQDTSPDWTSVRVIALSPDNTPEPLMPAGADTPTLFRLPSAAAMQGKIRVTAADRAGNRTTRDIDLNKPAAPVHAAKPQAAGGKPDPTLFTKDADPVAPTPDRGVRGAGFDLPKAPNADIPPIPMLPDVLPRRATDSIPDIKIPDAPPSMKLPDPPPAVKIPNDLDIKLPDLPGSTKLPEPPPAVKNPGDSDYKAPEVPTAKSPDVRPPLKAPEDPVKLPDLPPLPPAGEPMGIKPAIDIPPAPALPPAKGTSSALKPNGSSEMPKTEKKPEGLHPILNTRTCTVNYQLDGGARFTSKIDFWATPDNGRTWIPIKDLSGGTSPAKLTMPADGIFGIRIRPGGGAKPPEPGEDPDCVVEVDSKSPDVNLLPPSIGAEEGVMTLSWNASDLNLVSNSINLYYATRADGPWEVIASGYKNEGVYRWTLPAGLTGSVYLRMEAMDRAGNVGRTELPTPIALESGKARVKVIGVGPGK